MLKIDKQAALTNNDVEGPELYQPVAACEMQGERVRVREREREDSTCL